MAALSSLRIRGVTLVEVMIASVAGIVTLGGLATLYMQTLQAYAVSSRASTSYTQGGLVEDTLLQISRTAAPDALATFAAATNGADGDPLWVALGYDVIRDQQASYTGFYYPRWVGSTVSRETGLVFWWRDVNTLVGGRYMESNIYHLQCPTANLTSRYGQTKTSFTRMTQGEVGTFVNTLAYRQAARILASNILDFEVTKDLFNPPNDGPGALDWKVDYRIGN